MCKELEILAANPRVVCNNTELVLSFLIIKKWRAKQLRSGIEGRFYHRMQLWWELSAASIISNGGGVRKLEVNKYQEPAFQWKRYHTGVKTWNDSSCSINNEYIIIHNNKEMVCMRQRRIRGRDWEVGEKYIAIASNSSNSSYHKR